MAEKYTKEDVMNLPAKMLYQIDVKGISGNMKKWVPGIRLAKYKNYILVQHPHYRRCYTYADIMTGEQPIKEL